MIDHHLPYIWWTPRDTVSSPDNVLTCIFTLLIPAEFLSFMLKNKVEKGWLSTKTNYFLSKTRKIVSEP
jgi:hypothetical protein